MKATTFAMKDVLGHGLYSVREAALYARVTPQMVNRWLRGNKSGEAVLDAEYDQKDSVSFLDFIQLLAIRDIRQERYIPLNKFRQAIKTAQDNGFDHPFARKHCVYLLNHSFVITPPDKEPEEYLLASGKNRGQRLSLFMADYLEDLVYDTDGIVAKYRVFSAGRVKIEMDPKVRFGEPLLPSKYSAPAVWDAIHSEGSVEAASKCLGISVTEVRAGAEFYQHLVAKKAA